MAVARVHAKAARETVQRAVRESRLGPRHLGERAGPGRIARRRQELLAERPVKFRIVGHDEIRGADEAVRGVDVEALAAHHLVGQSGERDDVGGERPAGVDAPGARLVMQHVHDAPLGRVGEWKHREFDHVVVLRIGPRRLAVEVQAAQQRDGPGVAELGGQR